jgi:hypothetical protein
MTAPRIIAQRHLAQARTRDEVRDQVRAQAQAEGPSLTDVDELCAEFGLRLPDNEGRVCSKEVLRDVITAAITRWRAPVAQPAKPWPVNLDASAHQPLERLSMGKLVSERIQELLDEVAQQGLEPSGVILGIRAEELLRKEVRKSLIFQRNANQDNPLPLPNVQDQLFVYGVQVNKSDVEAAEYVGIECQ